MELTLEQALQKGVEAHKAGKVQEADRYYTAILKANPKHPDANHNMGVLAVGVGKVEEALPFFKTALEVNSSIAQFWLSYIDALIKLERIEDAKSVFEQAKGNAANGDGFDKLKQVLNTASLEVNNKTQKNIATQPNILDELKLDQALKLAKKKIKDGLSEEAKKIYQDILVKFPRNKKALDGIKTLASKPLANTTVIGDPPNDQLQVLVKLYTRGQYQEVLGKISQLLGQFPNSVNLYNILGAANQKLGKSEEAIEAYTKALSIKPDFAEAYNNMGSTLQDQGKLDDAIEAYTKALSIKPDYADACYNMGNTLQDQGKLDEAIEAYTKALSIKPDYADACYNMGNALQDQGKLDEALEAYSKALSIKPDFAEAYNNMGNTLQDQGKLDEAIEAYTKALSIKPDYAELYYNMGNALKDLGKLDEAIEAYTKALSIKPDYAEAIVNVSSLRNQISETTLVNKELEKLLENHNHELIAGPKFQIQQALRAFLISDQKLVRKHLNSYYSCPPSSITELKAKDREFCSAYGGFLQKLIETPFENEAAISDGQTVFHLGESHCLSYAHKKIKIQGLDHTVTPRITFGGKAYHFSIEKENAFKAITKANFHSLPNSSKVFISFGEIDCRQDEGIIFAAAKHKTPIANLVSDTIRGYVAWFAEQNQSKNHSLFFLNVPAPIYDEKYTTEINEEVSSTIQLFNILLDETASYYGFNLIDIYKFTVGRDRFSNGLFHIDNRHISSNAIPEIEKQVSTIL